MTRNERMTSSDAHPAHEPAPGELNAPLLDALSALARLPTLLIASDYDGTISPIVSDPSQAKPCRESMIALRALAELPHTTVALISGRSLADLAALSGDPDGIHLVGSHGSEFELGFAQMLSPEARRLHEEVTETLHRIARDCPGCFVEVKPASVAFHYRNAEPAAGLAALARAERELLERDGLFAKRGKMVLEFAVVSTHKGDALNTLRKRFGASAVLFIGDDTTDEDAFGTLAGPDVGVKVGEGESRARFRVADTDGVARVLATISELRSAWIGGAEAAPIEHHAMLTDQRTVALVAPGARVTWLGAPRIDSPSIFGELLGGPAAGRFVVSPESPAAAPTQRYEGDTFHLRTEWPGLAVTDYLDCSGGRAIQRPGRTDLIRVIEGTGTIALEFAPRLDYGRHPTRLVDRGEGLAVADWPDPIVLRSPGVRWRFLDEGPHHTASTTVDLADHGGRLVLELRYGSGDLSPAVIDEAKRSRQTTRHWTAWAEELELPGTCTDLVRRSALVLRGLCHGPTGAIAAAATTSLPECIGGVRNWDYRYCWPRDAALAASALVRLGSTGEAVRFLDWLLGIVDRLASPDRLNPIYTVSGDDLPAEAEIRELHGYAGSRPVRVGNAANKQLQLDVFGPIVELVAMLLQSGAPLSAEHARLVEAMVTAVAMRWRDPDHGIWEIRRPARHHVHSKVMCWQTAHLGAAIADRFLGRPRPEWHALADEIKADILAHGWDDSIGAFTSAYGEHDPDASVLLIGLTGLVEPGDPRFAGTIRAVERDLLRGCTVYRYHYDDGLPGGEGGFYLCTSWLIEALAISGRADEARALFDRYAATAGPTGLLPEQHDPAENRGLGNHPQAYSHIGLINAALRLDQRA
jgi:trehalose 6-phosphate phosphatase